MGCSPTPDVRQRVPLLAIFPVGPARSVSRLLDNNRCSPRMRIIKRLTRLVWVRQPPPCALAHIQGDPACPRVVVLIDHHRRIRGCRVPTGRVPGRIRWVVLRRRDRRCSQAGVAQSFRCRSCDRRRRVPVVGTDKRESPTFKRNELAFTITRQTGNLSDPCRSFGCPAVRVISVVRHFPHHTSSAIWSIWVVCFVANNNHSIFVGIVDETRLGYSLQSTNRVRWVTQIRDSCVACSKYLLTVYFVSIGQNAVSRKLTAIRASGSSRRQRTRSVGNLERILSAIYPWNVYRWVSISAIATETNTCTGNCRVEILRIRLMCLWPART